MPAASNCFWYSLCSIHVSGWISFYDRAANGKKNIRLVNFLEDVLEPAIVFLQDGVLSGQELETPFKTDVKRRR